MKQPALASRSTSNTAGQTSQTLARFMFQKSTHSNFCLKGLRHMHIMICCNRSLLQKLPGIGRDIHIGMGVHFAVFPDAEYRNLVCILGIHMHSHKQKLWGSAIMYRTRCFLIVSRLSISQVLQWKNIYQQHRHVRLVNVTTRICGHAHSYITRLLKWSFIYQSRNGIT